MKLPAVSLFSGAGGLDIGVDQAGFATLCSVELDLHCATTLRRNSRRKIVWQVDIRVLDGSRVAAALNLKQGDLALLHGGPPCQPFSQIGKKEGMLDPRGGLVFEMVRFTDALRPSAVIIEQVPNFLNTAYSPNTLIKDVLAEEFRDIGYDFHTAFLNALDYGVPQRRRRAIIVCVPSGQEYGFPFKLLLPEPTKVGEVLNNLPPPVKIGEEPLLPNHIDVTPPRDRDRISFVREGEWLSKTEAPPDIIQRLTSKDTTKFRRVDRNLPSPTLRCGEPLYHPVEDRYLTPREAARLQGFPDRHVFLGPIRRRSGSVRDLDQHRQVANAVPPPLAKAVASSVRESMCL